MYTFITCQFWLNPDLNIDSQRFACVYLLEHNPEMLQLPYRVCVIVQYMLSVNGCNFQSQITCSFYIKTASAVQFK